MHLLTELAVIWSGMECISHLTDTLSCLPHTGRSYVGINEEIMWVSIGMGVTIALLITIALCYIAREKCQKRQREYYVTA